MIKDKAVILKNLYKDAYKDIDLSFNDLHEKLKGIGEIFEVDPFGQPVIVNDKGIFPISDFKMPILYYRIMHDLGYLFMYPGNNGTEIVEVYDNIKFK